MRADFNVPLENGQITDDRRITQALPTINNIIERGGRLVLMSHLGRPKGGPEPKYSLKPVAERLTELLGKPVVFVNDAIGPAADNTIAALPEGGVLLLENLRFHKEEEANDPNFARQIAKNGDVYVNDAFGTAHREHASTFGVPQAMQGKPRVIGLLIQNELKFLGDAITNPARPFVAILGGAKVSDKIKVIQNLLSKADSVLIGGAMAYTFFLAQGRKVGQSLIESDKKDLAASLLQQAGPKLKLPVDTVVAPSIDSEDTDVIDASEPIPDDQAGFDIGPATCKIYRDAILSARTVIWNGPMGVFEKEPFEDGTQAVAEAVAEATKKNGATTLIGGGDSAAAVLASTAAINLIALTGPVYVA
ncbi:MAG: phosphoglycerate kinase, partial [Anaerolineae bacterium]|nr:phosphoglycerate kinase [Phycisphaerae bacterium]